MEVKNKSVKTVYYIIKCLRKIKVFKPNSNILLEMSS